MRLILLGSPGAGKGTQAKQIAAHFQIPAISTGDIFRQAIQNQTELGKKVKEIVESGHLVPDDLVIQLVLERLQQADCASGFLLDGFPRTLAQAIALQTQAGIDCVIDIEVPDNTIVERLSGRRVHPASGRTYHVVHQPPKQAGKDDETGEPLIQRPDDAEETIRERLRVYHSQTEPLQQFYQSQQDQLKYIKVDGTRPVEQVREELISQLSTAEKY